MEKIEFYYLKIGEMKKQFTCSTVFDSYTILIVKNTEILFTILGKPLYFSGKCNLISSERHSWIDSGTILKYCVTDVC